MREGTCIETGELDTHAGRRLQGGKTSEGERGLARTRDELARMYAHHHDCSYTRIIVSIISSHRH
jgi:hypothetical protein